MGRFYNGNINGKFWFGVQSSDDISNLINLNYKEVFQWFGCNCTLQDEDEFQNEYCDICYNSKDEFMADAIYEMSESDVKPYYTVEQITYDITAAEHLQQLEVSLSKLEQKIHKSIIDAFKEITEDTSDAFNGVFENVFKIYDELRTTNLQEIEIEIEEEEESVLEEEAEEAEEEEEEEEEAEAEAEEELVARYTLGFQIKQCLIQNGTCYVCCDL
jgi:DNA-directed RNA polymerase beta' subunit